jgi:hypothetical protein
MGYTLRAFLGPTPTVQQLASHFQHAHSVELAAGFSLLPMTEDLYDEVNNFVKSATIASCLFLTSYVEQQVFALIGRASIGYVEADYFASTGYQVGLLWQVGQRSPAPLTINAVLRGLGITASGGAMSSRPWIWGVIERPRSGYQLK